MQLRLIEIELNTSNPEASKEFYCNLLGLTAIVDEDGLKVFGTGVPDLHLVKSDHFAPVSISFYTDDIGACIKELQTRGVEIVEMYGDPVSALVLQDPDGSRVEIKTQHG